jgi:amino acid permease
MPIEAADEHTKLLAPAADEHTKLLAPASESAATSWSVFLNLTMTAVGAGCMALPYTLVASGYILGTLILFACAMLSGGSLMALAHLSKHTAKSDYSDIAEEILGEPGRLLTVLGIFLLLVGAAAAFLDISTDLLYPFAEDFVTSKIATRIGIAVFMALMSLPRTMHALRHVSAIGMSCLCYILVGVLWHIGRSNAEAGVSVHAAQVEASVRPFKPGLGMVLALNLQSMAYMCHPSVPILYAELRADCKHQMNNIIQMSVGFAFVFYFLMAAGHFFVQSGHPSGNLLADYGSGDAMMSIAKCVLSIVLILKSPLVYRPLHSLVYAALSLSPPTQLAGVIECFGLYSFLVVLTVYVPDLVTIMSWSGLTCGALIGFILPGVMLFVAAGKADPESSPSWTQGTKGRCVGALFATCGVFITVFGPFTIGFRAT